MDWAKVRVAIERGMKPRIERTGKISHEQYAMWKAVCDLHRAELWVLPKYQFDSTVVLPDHMKAPDLMPEYTRNADT